MEFPKKVCYIGFRVTKEHLVLLNSLQEKYNLRKVEVIEDLIVLFNYIPFSEVSQYINYVNLELKKDGKKIRLRI